MIENLEAYPSYVQRLFFDDNVATKKEIHEIMISERDFL